MLQEILTLGMLIFCSYTDLKYRKIYRNVIFFFLGAVLCVHIASGTSWTEIGAGALPGLGFLLLAFLSRQALGYGDAVLILVCGMSLGLERCFGITVSAFFWAGVWGLVLRRIRRADWKQEFAFVPFFLAGMLLQKLWTV